MLFAGTDTLGGGKSNIAKQYLLWQIADQLAEGNKRIWEWHESSVWQVGHIDICIDISVPHAHQVLLPPQSCSTNHGEDVSATLGGLLAEQQEMAVAAWPQREGLVAQLLPGLLVRLGRLLKVPVCLQLSIPERNRHGGIGHSVIMNILTQQVII